MGHGHFVRDWMTPTVIGISEHMRVVEALFLLKKKSIRFLPVLEGTKLLGIVAEKDLLHPINSLVDLDVTKMYRTEDDIPVKHIMTKKPITITAQDHIITAANLMVAKKVHGLPVLESVGSNHIVGVVTTTDLLRAFVELAELTRY